MGAGNRAAGLIEEVKGAGKTPLGGLPPKPWSCRVMPRLTRPPAAIQNYG